MPSALTNLQKPRGPLMATGAFFLLLLLIALPFDNAIARSSVPRIRKEKRPNIMKGGVGGPKFKP